MKENWVECTIQNIRLKTLIGFNEIETREKQEVVITISYKYNAQKAIESDNVDCGINYKTITKKVICFVEDSKFNLLETLADGILKMLAEFHEMKDLSVKVEKPGALSYTDNVFVKISS
jgi:FolB domain-containing protein